MTNKTTSKRPTNAELEILQVIWDRGPSTVREVFLELSRKKDVGHTTVLKLMQIMAEKQLLVRDSSRRPQVFRPTRSLKQTQRRLLGDLADRGFGGSPGDVGLQALSARKSTPEERQQIRDLLDRLEREER